MITISIKGLIPLSNALKALPKQVELATQAAVLKTARSVREAEVIEMRRVFSNPTRFTLNALETRVNRKAMSATVEVKEEWQRADIFLAVQRDGGGRKHKAFEKALQRVGVLPAGWMAVPGQGATMDAYGNMSVGQIRQILSWFDAAERVLGSMQNMGDKGRAKKRKGTKKTAAFEYFVIQPGNKKGKLMPGIYKRFFFGMGTSVKPMLIFIRAAVYSKRFRFFEVAQQTVDKVFQREFDAAVSKYLPKTL